LQQLAWYRLLHYFLALKKPANSLYSGQFVEGGVYSNSTITTTWSQFVKTRLMSIGES
jgi:hypothetical protein